MKELYHKLYTNLLSYEQRLWLYKIRHLKEYRDLRSIIHPSPKGDFSLKGFDENKSIFVHITKSAGTSIARSLFGYLPYHYTAIDYRVIFGTKNFNNYFKFAFVRNPWDRVYSAYRFLKSGGWNDDDKSWAENNLSNYNDFNEFILSWLSPSNIKKHIHFKPQHEFICDNKGNIMVNYIAYFEKITSDFDYLANHLNLDVTLGKHNTNPGENYRDIYSEEAKNKVAIIYEKDISLFGYNFNGIESAHFLNNQINRDKT